MTKPLLFALLGLFSLTGCEQSADEIRPANYDVLAMETGHWEWDSWQNGFSGSRTPTSVGFTQQLIFGTNGQLTLRRNGQVARQAGYKLSVESFTRCGKQLTGKPLITFSNETDLFNDDAKTYDLSQSNGKQMLTLIGKEACVDYGATETYHWVKE